MLLYPQLPRPVSQHLAAKVARLDIVSSGNAVAVDHRDLYYAATGGRRIETKGLQRLRDQVVSVSEGKGFPGEGTETERAEFDQDVALILYDTMDISAHEASRPGVWEFLTCVLLCDVVRWRFPGGSEGTPLERFLFGRRNTLQRLWWRAFVLSDPTQQDPHQLLRSLGEDEIVQIMERPFLAGTAPLARAVARQLLEAAKRHNQISRRHLIREGQKHMRRLASFTAFDAVDETVIDRLVQDVFDQVAEAGLSSAKRRARV